MQRLQRQRDCDRAIFLRLESEAQKSHGRSRVAVASQL